LDLEELTNALRSATVLDCTLRDGGYCNNWEFSDEIAERLLLRLSKAGITNIEVGFRSYRNNELLGPAAFSTDKHLDALSKPSDAKLWVMTNASDLVGPQSRKKIDKLFALQSDSPVNGVRIATTINDLEAIKETVSALNNKGYRVAVNLMQAGSLTLEDIDVFAAFGAKTNPEILYLADTNGTMTPPAVMKYIKHLTSKWSGRIGFHAHDNLGFALLNSANAIKAGAVQIDSTMLGMGRGAGNLRTEELMTYKLGSHNIEKLAPLYDLVSSDYQPLKLKHQWGYNPVFVLSGINNIQPDYALETIQNAERDSSAKLGALLSIPKQIQVKYSRNVLADTLELSRSVMPLKGFNLKQRHSNVSSAILLGPGVSDSEEPIVWKFAENYDLPVFALNDTAQSRDDDLSGRFVANPSKFQAQSAFFKQSSSLLIAPFERLGNKVEEILLARKSEGLSSVMYRTEVAENLEDESWGFSYCSLNKPLSFAYALAYLATSDVQILYLAGFEGYASSDDLRHEVSARAIRMFLQRPGSSVYSLTPSHYRIPKASPHGPLPKDSGE
jgi:4-hydroxy 2-oxovalerate aldolase